MRKTVPFSSIEARFILEELSFGFDPESGEAIDINSCLHRPAIRRALALGASALSDNPRRNTTSSRAGEGWTRDEEQELIDLFRSNQKKSEIARMLRRSPGAINSRLKKLGLIGPEEDL